jgi:hypothetical protein
VEPFRTDLPPCEIRTIIYNNEEAPWSRNNHLMDTRLLPASDDGDNKFSGNLLQNPQIEISVNQNTLVTTIL